MYAELILNRGFNTEDRNKDGVSDPWYIIKDKDSCIYSIDTENSFNSGKSQKIQVVQHNFGYCGIGQGNLIFQKKEIYNGYLYIKAKNFKGHLEIVFKNNLGKNLEMIKLNNISDQYKKYNFTFKNISKELAGILEIRVLGEGSVWLDQVSLAPESAVNGIWKDVAEKVKELDCGIIRFPGGCFADCYFWEDGIGPRDNRPTKLNGHWSNHVTDIWDAYEDNSFGTNEYIEFCRNVDVEPFICVNFGSSTPEDAANWVEYCNGSLDTKYGKLRAKNGYHEPFNVKYWDIGNENFGDWEIGHLEAGDYAKKYTKFYDAMKAKDPDIKIVSCGGDGNRYDQNWNKELFKTTNGKMDYLSLHYYAPQIFLEKYDQEEIYYGTVGAVEKYNRQVQLTRQTIKEYGFEKKIDIAITEYNAMYCNESWREHSLEAAIFNAGLLNLFIRNSDIVTLCNFSDLVNGWEGGCIVSDRGNVYCTASYYVLKLYSSSAGKEYLETDIISDDCFKIGKLGHLEDLEGIKYLDAVVTSSGNELIFLLINRHLEKTAEIELDIYNEKINGEFKAEIITANQPHVRNYFEDESIKIKETKTNIINSSFEIAPMTIMKLVIKPGNSSKGILTNKVTET